MYSIANYIARNYDKVVIGDYSPTLEVATEKNMHRGMLNQSLIGMFRKILSWTMEKYNKTCIVVNEKDATKSCCICGNLEKKDPSIREFTCKECNTTILRDVNSAINIARKNNLEPTNKVLNKIIKKGYFRFDKYTTNSLTGALAGVFNSFVVALNELGPIILSIGIMVALCKTLDGSGF